MTVLCLVRHGETEWNVIGKLQGRENIELNKNGKQQAEKCGLYLREKPWDIIISSPLSRAKQTAEIINTFMLMPINIIEMENFIERDYGTASGLTTEERTKMFPNRNYLNQEPREVLNARIITSLNIILKKYPESNVILVTHSAVINTILAIISNNEIGSGKTKLFTACISSVYYHQEQWKICEYNKIDHLRTNNH
ncbi:histidine phosphatase family protein [Bacillus cereus]|uniref:Histidine phosphatase family protein n=1 Tax=Bacillus cereus TaxID=1396 RepID=A0A2B2FM59_BACCE|nr:histidine phosphatase family protein [Bacillus cereus]MDR4984480.1 histidine phosphatase family protein [Bacillus cereus]PES99715.1 histidine phosphatase family protein [Bacillus cereus]PFP72473.1 histidine phosphatase family protein [Bacillus cereus]